MQTTRPSPGAQGAVALIGAPVSSGAYSPGQEDAPAALRDAGLVAALRAAGAEVVDLGDVPRRRWRPDREDPRAMNLADVRGNALAVADRVGEALDAGLRPVVLGGDCTVELGTMLARRRRAQRATLVYIDRHPDMNTPGDVPDGALDWMGVAHLLALDGARPELSHLDAALAPLLGPGDLLLFGAAPGDASEAEQRALREHPEIEVVDHDAIRADGVEAAVGRAVAWARDRPGPVDVHFDVDTIDFADAPLAENTSRNVNLSFEEVLGSLHGLLAGLDAGAVTITELNPHHGEPDGSTLRRFVDRLAPALAAAA